MYKVQRLLLITQAACRLVKGRRVCWETTNRFSEIEALASCHMNSQINVV